AIDFSAVPNRVWNAWKRNQSYYALKELVDEYIEGCGGYKASRDEVRLVLGEPMDEYAGHKKNDYFWVYTSSRRIPCGTYLLITYDEKGFVSIIEWADE